MVYYFIRVNQNILSDKTQIQGNEEKTKKAKVISPRLPDFLSAISCFENTGKITFRIEKIILWIIRAYLRYDVQFSRLRTL